MSISKQKPFFSILIPSYNRPEDITKTIDSVLKGEFRDFEIIISDDCSPKKEAVARVIEPYLKNENISFYPQGKNLREPDNKNFLVNKAKGKFNIVIGDDDQFCSNALSILKRYIDENPDVDFFGFGYRIVDENGKVVNLYKTNKKININHEEPRLLKEMFKAQTLPLWIFHPATFCCKAGIEEKLPYQKDVGMAEDMWFMFDLLSNNHKMLIIPEYIFNWRKIQDQSTTKQKNQSLEHLANFKARYLMYKKFEQNVSQLPKSVLAYISTKDYREVFIYKSLILDKSVGKDDYKRLGLNKDYLVEIEECAKKRKILSHSLRHGFYKIITFLRAVGIVNGSCSLFRMINHKLFYKFEN